MTQIPPTDLRPFIRTIVDYPRPGILFRDITTLLGDARALTSTLAQLAAPWLTRASPMWPASRHGDSSWGSRGLPAGAGFVPLRKKGKLPHTTIRVEYQLEYGLDELEMHADGTKAGDRVLLVDDLIATGGSAAAGISLLRSLDATVVGAAFVIDLPELGGTARLEQGRHQDRVAGALRRPLTGPELAGRSSIHRSHADDPAEPLR